MVLAAEAADDWGTQRPDSPPRPSGQVPYFTLDMAYP
jgi:hypothetical protein